MIRQLAMAGMLLAGGMAFGDEIIAHWDFSKGKTDSVDGKFKMHCRGNTRIEGPAGKQYLEVGITGKDTPEGITSVKKISGTDPEKRVPSRNHCPFARTDHQKSGYGFMG